MNERDTVRPDIRRTVPVGTGTVLVTGGAGFIGANVVRLLLQNGYRVRVFDDFSGAGRDNLTGLDVDSVTGDVCDFEAVYRALDGCRSVVHLAAKTSVLDSVEDPLPTFRVNAEGTLTALRAAVRAGVSKFILASSNAAIGEHPPPLHEQLVPRPKSPYGASKLAAEGYCAAFHGAYALDVVMLRFANVYGPFSANKTSVVAKFFRRLSMEEPIIVYGDGSQTRDFIYVDDVARAIMLALEKPLGCATLQIGTGRETSIAELTAMLIELTGRSAEIQYAAPQPGEIHRNYVSIERAVAELGFNPRWELRDGLQSTLAWLSEAAIPAKARR